MTHVPFKRSFLFLKVNVKRLNDIVEELISFKEVKEVHVITGKKDLFVALETEYSIARQSEDIIDFIVNKIGKIKGVEDTNTIIPTSSRYKW